MFGSFKATLNLLGGKRSEHSELSTDLHVTGAYRVNRENLYGYSTQDAPKSKPSEQPAPLRQVKSTSNLIATTTQTPRIRNTSLSISSDPRGAEQPDNPRLSRKELKTREKDKKNREKEQKNREKEQKKEQDKLEKQRATEQKKQAQEKAKQDKRNERAKKEAQKKVPAKKQVKPLTNTRVQQQSSSNTQPQTSTVPQTVIQRDNTNTLDSSISRTSGPPPYTELPNPTLAKTDTTGNVVYSKPVDTGSWDIVSQHREQINRPAKNNNNSKPTVVTNNNNSSKSKTVVMDLNYNVGENINTYNSEA